MTMLAPIPPERWEKLLTERGFELAEMQNAHAFYRHSDGRQTVLPLKQGELCCLLTAEMLRQINMPVYEYVQFCEAP